VTAPSTSGLSHRLARLDELDALRTLMAAAIGELQKPFLDARQIEAAGVRPARFAPR
jgi:hypothetical protein